MELHCLPAETPTTASSSSTDPLYDNFCLPHAQRGRERDRGMRTLCPAVTRLPAPCSPLSGLAPAVPKVPTLGGGRGPGAWPDHNYSSWGGGLRRQGWGVGLGPGINRAGGGERGGGGGREGLQDAEEEERGHQNQNPSPTQSEEHKSALSVYDNLHDAVTPDDQLEDLLEVVAMETGLQDPLQQQLCRAEEGGRSGESSSWSSCEILLAGSSASNGPDQDQDADQEKDPAQDPELDSESFPVDQGGPVLHIQLPAPHHQPPLPASLPHLSPPILHAQGSPIVTLHPGDPPQQGQRVPPPLPLADPSASALRSLLTGLQQQIVRQRDEYEARIHSLEQRNVKLQGEVMGLRANLAQQRRWYRVVQAKILESEQARAAADLRNAALQTEMEQFFDTFGELNNEAKKTEQIVRTF